MFGRGTITLGMAHILVLNTLTAGHVLSQVVFAVKIAHSHVGIWTPCNTWFPGSTWVIVSNGITIGSATFVGLSAHGCDWWTDRLCRQIDGPRFFVCSNRQYPAGAAMWPNHSNNTPSLGRSPTLLLPLTFPNANQFSKFFHWQT